MKKFYKVLGTWSLASSVSGLLGSFHFYLECWIPSQIIMVLFRKFLSSSTQCSDITEKVLLEYHSCFHLPVYYTLGKFPRLT